MFSFDFFFKKPKTITLDWLGVDMHSHILPGIDDGSKDIRSSVSFIRGLSELGIEKFICTPHIFTEVYPNSRETIFPVLEQLRAKLKEEKIDVQVEAAAEYMMDLDFLEILKSDNILPLHGNHVLVEMSYQVETRNVDQFIFDLHIKGHQPVLAHPERYIYYHNNFEQFKKMKDQGCLFQVNMLSLAGYYGKAVKQVGLALLKEKMIDIVGTDLHHIKHLEYITKFVRSGAAGKLLADYPVRNNELFR